MTVGRPQDLFQPAHPRSKGGAALGQQTSARLVRDLVDSSMRAGQYRQDRPLEEHVLTQSLGASRTAVRTALQTLADRGQVVRRPRTGTFPANISLLRINMDDVVASSDPQSYTCRCIDHRVVRASPLVSEMLKTDDTSVKMVDLLLLHNGEPIGTRTAYFRTLHARQQWNGPLDNASVFRNFFGSATYRVAWTEIGSRLADQQTADLLCVPTESALLTRQQVFESEDGEPLQVSFDQYRADQVTFVSGQRD